MENGVDVVSVIMRALSFVTLLQAAGLTFFLALFAQRLEQTRQLLERFGVVSALVAIAFVVMHHLLEAGRMAGELSGVVDASLQHLAITSSSGAAAICRVIGLLLIAIGFTQPGGAWRSMVLIGAVLASGSFLLTGHTSIHAQRGWLAPLLAIHLIVVAFWFGALLPLCIVSNREPAVAAAGVIAAFTAIATWLVPVIAIVGIIMAWMLLPSAAALLQPYGLLLLTKVSGFVILLGLAALNKWRLGPAMLAGGAAAGAMFRRSVLIEFGVMCGVLSATAAMTAFFSPDG